MAFDRKKFKKANIEEVDESLNKAQETMSRFGGQGGRASFMSLSKEGRYEIRILPSTTGRPYVACKCAKLPIESPVYDKDGKKTGQSEVKMKDVFTSDIHSDRMEGKDAVDIYIKFVEKMASEIQDSDEKRKFLAPINGYRKKTGEWVWGIAPTLNYVAYVYCEKEIYRLNIRPQWWKQMKSISIERSKNAVSLDVFSDDEKGYPLIINYYKDEKSKAHYDLSCALPEVGQDWNDFFESNRVSDSVLEVLDSLPSLDDMYINVFSRKDWDMQLEGLKRFDDLYGFNVFEEDEFLDQLEALEALVPEPEDVKQPAAIEQESRKKEDPKPKQSTKKAAASKEGPSYPSLLKMKTELSEYIEVEYEGTKELPELPIVEMRKWYDLMKQGMMLPFEDYIDEEDDLPFDTPEEEEEEDLPVEEAPARSAKAVPTSIKDKLAALRASKGKK